MAPSTMEMDHGRGVYRVYARDELPIARREDVLAREADEGNQAAATELELRRAAATGGAKAQETLRFWLYMHGGPASQYEARQRLRSAAERDMAGGAFFYAQMCYLGHGGPRALELARQWYGVVARQGHVTGQLALARMLRAGEGGALELAQARSLFRSAALAGDAEAQFRLGEMCRDGEGREQSEAEAREWFEKAADGGCEEAWLCLWGPH